MKISEVVGSIPDADTCAVYAISHITGVSPEQVWEIAQPLWRQRFGMHSGQISSVLTELGFEFGKFRYDLVYRPRQASTNPYIHLTLGQLLGILEKNPSVPLLIGTRGHAIGYRDGKLLDVANTGNRSRVQSVYEIHPKTVR